MTRLAHVLAVDDAPFERDHRGDVTLVATVFAGTQLHGVAIGRARRDGANATRAIAELVDRSRFRRHLQAILLQGIAVAGFNVVDIHGLAARTGLAVLVVARRAPDLSAIRRALLALPGGRRKWRLVERAGPMEPVCGVHMQRSGLSAAQAAALLARSRVSGLLPEPLRTAHIIASAFVRGESRGRA